MKRVAVISCLLLSLSLSKPAIAFEDTPTPARKSRIKIGEPARPVNAGEWINSEALPKNGLAGKVLLVEFWATWCGSCIVQLPHMQEVYKEFGPKGLLVLALTDESREEVEPFFKNVYPAIVRKNVSEDADTNIPDFPIGLESGSASDYAIFGWPETYLIGGDGLLRKIWRGCPPAEELEAEIKAALGLPSEGE